MMTAYRASGDAIDLSVDRQIEHLPDDVIWLDLKQPSRFEDNYAERLTGISVPTHEDLMDSEPSSRLYAEGKAIYLTGSLLCHADSLRPVLADVGFILTERHLVTVRYDSPKSFQLFAGAIARLPNGLGTAPLALARLIETVTDRTAEILEKAEVKSDGMLLRIFGEPDGAKHRRAPGTLEKMLIEIAHHHRLVSKSRDSLVSLARLVSFFSASAMVQADRETRELCASIARDIQSLSEHANFISSNLSFMLDASLGLINVEQNAIIKIFSIASVVFLPPTLVASIYGMNFQHMPELAWLWGYPASIGLMIVSAIVPYFVFRWKGWL